MIRAKFKKIFHILIFYIFGISLVIEVVINSTFLFNWSIKIDNLGSVTGLSDSVIKQNYMELLNYLRLPWIHSLKMTSFNSSSHGLQHLEEVKNLFNLNAVLLVISLVILLIMVRSFNRNKKWWQFYNVMKIAYLVPIAFGTTSLFDFNQVFIWFHELLFRNNYWIFDPDKDPVINILTDNFFLMCFIYGFILLEVYFLVINLYIKKRLIN